jgi:hypothetical protein
MRLSSRKSEAAAVEIVLLIGGRAYPVTASEAGFLADCIRDPAADLSRQMRLLADTIATAARLGRSCEPVDLGYKQIEKLVGVLTDGVGPDSANLRSLRDAVRRFTRAG